MPWIRTMASRRRVTRTNIREWGPIMIHRDGSRLHAKMNVEHRWCWLADGKSSLNRNCFLSSRCFLCWLNGWMIELWKVHCLIKNGEAKEAESGSRITNFSVNLERFNYRFHFERGRFVIFLVFSFFLFYFISLQFAYSFIFSSPHWHFKFTVFVVAFYQHLLISVTRRDERTTRTMGIKWENSVLFWSKFQFIRCFVSVLFQNQTYMYVYVCIIVLLECNAFHLNGRASFKREIFRKRTASNVV